MRIGQVRIVCLIACLLGVSAQAASRDLRLINAVQGDDARAAKTLIASGVDVNARAGDGSTALHWAAQNDDLALAEALIRKGAKVDATNDLGVTALWIGASNAGTAMVQRLLAAGADPNIAPTTGHTPLMVAARRGDNVAVKALLVRGADPNARESAHGQTALMWAVSGRHAEVARLLLAAHADVRARSKSWTQRAVLCCQLYGGDAETAADVAKGGFTPLLFAAQYGDVETVRVLIAAGADVNDVSADGASAVVLAAHAGQTEAAVALLDAGADPNAALVGYGALHVAATRGDVALVQALLAHGADPNARQQRGSPTKRVRTGHSLDQRMIGATPFFLAARSGRLDVMKLLAGKGADTSIPLLDGRNVLMVLTAPGSIEGPDIPGARAAQTITLAVQLGTPVNQADANGDTALHIAATRRRDEIVQALADSGAALNARNHEGETPLAAALKPPAQSQGSAVADDYDYLLNHTQTAELLRRLGATS